jgi:hypothetical protein
MIVALAGCSQAPVSATRPAVSSPEASSPVQQSGSPQPSAHAQETASPSAAPRVVPSPIPGPPRTVNITFVLVVHGAVPPTDGLGLYFFYPRPGQTGFFFCDSTPARPCNVPGAVLDLDFRGLAPQPMPVRYLYYVERRGQAPRTIAQGSIYLNSSTTVSASISFI